MRKTIIAQMIGATLGRVECAAIPVDIRNRAYFGARGGGKSNMNYQSFIEAANKQARNKETLRIWFDESGIFTEAQWQKLTPEQILEDIKHLGSL